MEGMSVEDQRKLILDGLAKAIDDFFIADRKMDPVLPAGVIEAAVREMEPSIAELTLRFSELIREHVPIK